MSAGTWSALRESGGARVRRTLVRIAPGEGFLMLHGVHASLVSADCRDRRRRLAMLWLCSILAALAVVASLASISSAATLQINEFLAGPARDWDGSGAVSTRDDEWVEVVNVSGAPLDLAGFII